MVHTVALLAALAGGLWIDVPFVRQEKNGCGAASIWMVMQYWKTPAPASEDIHDSLYSKAAGGVFASDMQRYLDEHRFKTLVFTGTWEDLLENVSQGRPLIVCLETNSRGTFLHYVVVAGVDEAQQIVLINDPARRKLWPMPRSEFERRWAATNKWTLLATPEEPPPSFIAEPAPRVVAVTPELEAASAAFRSENYGLALNLARQAVSKAPNDPVANQLLATVFFLQENLEAAIKYWNRVDMPRVRDIRSDPETRWNPLLLDRTFAIARGAVLDLDLYRLTRKRLDASGTFSTHRLELTPAQGNDFDLTMRAAERNGRHPLSWLRGLPYQTLTPEIANIRGRAINLESMWRWDVHKRRIALSLSAPAGTHLRYRFGVDYRNEEWDWNGERFRLWRQEIAAGIEGVTSRWRWSTGSIVSRRSSGVSLKYDGAAIYDIWRVPEKRWTVSSGVRAQVARIFSRDRHFIRTEASTHLRWLPRSKGTDYETSLKVRAGRVWGEPPFDELFSVGLDRDHDLWMRGHPGTRDGRKGVGLIGGRYFLGNFEVAKTVFEWTFVGVRAVPFVDVARVGDWFVDAGVEVRVSVASFVTVSLSAGRDLKAGRTTVFTSTAPARLDFH